MTNIIAQFTDDFINPNDPIKAYYKKVYTNVDGLDMPAHNMEIPAWIAYLTPMIQDPKLWHIQNFASMLNLSLRVEDGDTVYLSVMDANLSRVIELLELIDVYPRGRVILGGYVDPKQFEQYEFVEWYNSLHDMYEARVTTYPPTDPDYRLFRGVKTIPRLTLSAGCNYACKFCTIPQGVTDLDKKEIMGQIMSFAPLSYKYIYIDDKTFGQSKTAEYLSILYDFIIAYSPEFIGFIVQTTVKEASLHWEYWYNKLHVKIIEVGVEYPDEKFLKDMNKPYSMGHLNNLLSIRKHNRPLMVANLIFGLPEPYTNTAPYDYILWQSGPFDWVNPYILSIYDDAKGDIVTETEQGDGEEGNFAKSWVSDPEKLKAYVIDYCNRFTS